MCVCVCVCDLESSTLRRHEPKLGFCAQKNKILPRTRYVFYLIYEQKRGCPLSGWLAFWSLGAVWSALYLGRVSGEWRLTGVHLCERNVLIWVCRLPVLAALPMKSFCISKYPACWCCNRGNYCPSKGIFW